MTHFKFSQYYGINSQEMDTLIQHFGIKESQAASINEWYNGYQLNIGTSANKNFITKYNICSIINYLNKQESGFINY